MRLYEIEYSFIGEKQFQNALVVVYKKDETDLIKAFDEVADGDPPTELNKILLDKFGLTDDDITWYQEGDELDEEDLEVDAGIYIRNSWDKTAMYSKHD